MWPLVGTADYLVDFTSLGTVCAGDQETTVATRCTGTATYQVTAQVFKDAVLSLE